MKPSLGIRELNAADFGKHLFYVRATQKAAKEYEITVRADGYNIDEGGVLTFYQEIDEDNILNTLSLKPEAYLYVYLANPNGQYPWCVERWNGVANVRIIEKDVLAKREVIKESADIIEKEEGETDPVELEAPPIETPPAEPVTA